MTTSVRYTVRTAPAYLSADNLAGINRMTLVGSYARKGEALAAAQAALNAFRLCHSVVDRERFVVAMNPITGGTEAYWNTEARVKEYSRYLRPEERAEA